jgi:serine/threonine protein kinase
MIGQTLGHYEILDRLGAGGMGEVYRAEDTRLQRQVALKILPPEMAKSQERLVRFQREAQTLAALDHPNIVHIYSVERGEDVHFLTMQLIQGKRLSDLTPEEGMPLEQILEIAIPLADALRAAHEKGITHRDLKPENVMIDLEGRVKILDFGLAKLRLPDPGPEASQLRTEAMTQEGMVLGTVPYMSPEQVQGEPVDHRTDIFSLGIVLYEMASGLRPFRGANSASLMSSILRDQPAPVSDVKAGLPEELGRILSRCLEKNPERRFQSARSLRDELKELELQTASGQLASERVEVPSASTARDLPKPRWLALALAALFVAVLVGLQWWRSGPPSPEPETPQITSLAVLPLRNLSGDAEQDYFADGMTEALILDLSKIGALKVISRTSIMRFKETDRSVAVIARELGVDAVVEGSVLREGSRVGITAQLIEASSDRTLWAERYQRDLTSILSLQAEVARAIAGEIRVSLTPQEESLLAATRTVDPEAHEAYLKGRFYRDRFTPQDLETALQYFERALEIDPSYALAHHGVGSVWGYRTVLGVATPREAWPKSAEALERTLALDDSVAEAHLSLANLKVWYEWDWEGGELAFLRAIELNPN